MATVSFKGLMGVEDDGKHGMNAIRLLSSFYVFCIENVSFIICLA